MAGEVAVVLLTHHHPDHAEAAREFAERVGCGVRALDPEYRLGSEGLADGDVVEVDGLEVRVIGTPGHTADSLSFLVPAEGAVLTGDTVLGRGTTVVAHPDGQLGAYLSSLDRLHALASAHELSRRSGPGHGPVIADALGGARLLPRAPPGAAGAGRGGRRLAARTPPTPKASPPTSSPAASSRSSTPTSTRSSGAPPSSPSAPSWSTSPTVESGPQWWPVESGVVAR